TASRRWNWIDLLSPDGPFGIGTRTYHWVDQSRHEKASKDPAEFRQVVVQVWYPAKSRKEPTAPYVPQRNAYRHVWEKSEVDLAIRTRTHSHIDARPEFLKLQLESKRGLLHQVPTKIQLLSQKSSPKTAEQSARSYRYFPACLEKCCSSVSETAESSWSILRSTERHTSHRARKGS